MNTLLIPLADITPGDVELMGGKAVALSRLRSAGFTVPDGLCLTTEVYREAIRHCGVEERILLELNRKRFEEMRWEEIWDVALRIRSVFLRAAMPPGVCLELGERLRERFGGRPVAVRSSAPAEDAADTSFAGLHDSYLNVSGEEDILKHIRLVWASLWSDRALLYRRELGLSVHDSAMAVLIQEMIPSEKSGVAFTVHPNRGDQGIIEAVHGLNEGLVDGTVQPDRWTIRRADGCVLNRQEPEKRGAIPPTAEARDGTGEAFAPALDRPPLSDDEVLTVWDMACRAEAMFGRAVDIEWTIARSVLYTLQARPITTGGCVPEDGGDQRTWYLSLTRSFEDLRNLRVTIETIRLPEMRREADAMARVDLETLDRNGLAEALAKRHRRTEHWKTIYWNEFIPFAHGIRLFGQVYNDTIQGDDPHEFVELLARTPMISVRRNQALQDLAQSIRQHPEWLDALRDHALEAVSPEFGEAVRDFMQAYGSMFELTAPGKPLELCLAALLEHMAQAGAPPARSSPRRDTADKEKAFVNAFPQSMKQYARDLLDLARASYRLRDDDNVYLGRIEAELLRARELAIRKLGELRDPSHLRELDETQLAEVLWNPEKPLPAKAPGKDGIRPETGTGSQRARQLVGQPAGPGIATGKARVLVDDDQLFEFKKGEILVCDAINPNMTFVVPMAKAIVERRGGMLIHGAIIAREYGLPCVTGVPGAVDHIRSGSTITVDGYLGIVTIAT